MTTTQAYFRYESWAGRKKNDDCSLCIWGYLAIAYATWTAGRHRRKTAPCVFCEARCLKWQRPLTLHLKAWPLIQPTNCSMHTQLSGDNHFTNVRLALHAWALLDRTSGTHCFSLVLCLSPQIGRWGLLCSLCWFPYSLLLLMRASELMP